jgi:hypothetical protein
MQKLFRCLLATAAIIGVAVSADAGELTVTIADGKATILAKDVPVRQILAEWARVGGTRMVNAEKIPGGPVTLQLVEVPEKEALDLLLRSAAGYLAAPRQPGTIGSSQYDRVMILATSRPPANPAPSTQPRPMVTPMPAMPPQPPPDVEDEGEPSDQGPMPTPGLQPFPGPNNPNQAMPFPGPTQAPNPNVDPNAEPGVAPATPPMTAPRPGMLPQPQPQPQNPYGPIVRPGAPNRRGGDPDDR